MRDASGRIPTADGSVAGGSAGSPGVRDPATAQGGGGEVAGGSAGSPGVRDPATAQGGGGEGPCPAASSQAETEGEDPCPAAVPSGTGDCAGRPGRAAEAPSSLLEDQVGVNTLPPLLTVRKVMPHEPWGCYTGSHEIPRVTCRIGTQAASGRPARLRGIPDRGGRRLPRRPSHDRVAMDRCLPRPGVRRSLGACRLWPTPKADDDPSEDRLAWAGRRPHRARLRHRALDRRPARPVDRAGVRRRLQPARSQRLAAVPGPHPAEAPARATEARSGRDPGVARLRLAAPPKKARRQGAYLAWIDESGLLMAPLVRRTWAPRGQTPELAQRSGHREKVSVAAALGLSPHRDRMGCNRASAKDSVGFLAFSLLEPR